MSVSRPTVQHRLTAAQACLVERHERGLRRLADTLAAKNCVRSMDLMFVLADPAGRIGGALRAALPTASIGPVVLPGRAAELSEWVARLAIHGPVWDFSAASAGIPVIVVDADDSMAVARLDEHWS